MVWLERAMSIRSAALVARGRYCERPQRRGARRLLGLALAVLVAHAFLLHGVRDALDAGRRAAPVRPAAALQTRSVALAAAAEAVAAAAEEPVPAPISKAAPRAGPVQRAAPPRDELAREVAAPVQPPAAAPTAPPAPTAAAAPAGDLPIYPTRMPPAFSFGYELRRGSASGQAEWRWQPQGEQYQTQLVAASGGAPALAWVSVGGFDAAGLAPLRYTERRRGSSMQAANFQRAAGKITFSGPATEYALPPGAQDRLSWMLQLAAVAAANPALLGPAGRVSLLVVGARGDAEVWTFVPVGEEAIALADASMPAVRLLREPQRAYDTRAEVWLAPALHYLPVQLRLSNGAAGDALQLTLREPQFGP